MALQWQWKEIVGAAKVRDPRYKDPYWVTIYEGNALLIMNYEDEKQYMLWNFLANKQHLKNCKKAGIKLNVKFDEVRIFKKYSKYWKDIIEYLFDEDPDCKITISIEPEDREKFWNPIEK